MLSATVADSDELIAPHPLRETAAAIIMDIEIEFLIIDSKPYWCTVYSQRARFNG
jgi:hypothetical protein